MLIRTSDGWRPLLSVFPTREKDRPGKGLKHTARRDLSPEMQAIAARVPGGSDE